MSAMVSVSQYVGLSKPRLLRRLVFDMFEPLAAHLERTMLALLEELCDVHLHWPEVLPSSSDGNPRRLEGKRAEFVWPLAMLERRWSSGAATETGECFGGCRRANAGFGGRVALGALNRGQAGQQSQSR